MQLSNTVRVLEFMHSILMPCKRVDEQVGAFSAAGERVFAVVEELG